MKLFSIIMAITTVGFCEPLFSQSGNLQAPKTTIHSPNAASLGQYGEYNVDVSTGVPAINIPLYTIKGSKLEFPISVAYHASGIRVDQEASFVGLGWTLNASGIITRVIKDKVDEHGNGFITTGNSLPDYDDIYDLQAAGRIGTSTYLKQAFTTDKQPDVFSISVNGLSDEFCLNNAGNFVSLDLEPLKYNVDLFNKLIVVTDKVGTIYRFGKNLNDQPAYETTHIAYNSILQEGYTSSWYLTEIISADYSDTIRFKYRSTLYSNEKVINVTRYLLNAEAGLSPIDQDGVSFDQTTMTFANTAMTNQQVVDSIQFKNGYIVFSSANDRIDQSTTNSTRITGFIIYDDKNNATKKIVFDNADYFTRTGTGSAIDYMPIPDHRKKSLRLNAVKFYDAANDFVNDYKFQYESTPLPGRNTTSQDYWGYYNGKINTSLIPQSFYVTAGTGKPVYLGDNRRSDFNFMKAASLKQISFPTGGYTQYEYEPNYYLSVNQTQSQSEENKQRALFAINRHTSCDPDYLNGVPANNSLDFTVVETIGNNGVDVGKLTIVFSDYLIWNGLSMTAKLTNLTSGQEYLFAHPPADKDQRKVINQDVTIRAGHSYRLELKTNGVTGSNTSMCNSPTIEAYLSYKHWVTTTTEQINPEQAGGLRVKAITHFKQDGSPASKKIYEYGDTKYGPQQIGVGTLISDPSKNFYNYPLLYTTVHESLKELKNVLWFTSDSQVELGQNNGCPVDYTMVTEKTVSYNDNNVTNGKTEYLYNTTGRDVKPGASTRHPYDFFYFPSWDKNTLKKVIHYQLSGSTYSPVKTIEYEYEDQPEQRIKTLEILEFQPDIFFASAHVTGGYMYSDNNPNRFFYYNYYVSRGKKTLKKEITSEYLNGQLILKTDKFFEYNNSFDVKKEYFVNSKGQQSEIVSKYTADLDYTTLVSKNILSLPVLKEKVVAGNVSNGSVLKYNNSGQVTDLYTFKSIASVTPITYTNAATIPSYYEKKEELFYDANGSIRERQKSDDIKSSYLWGYNNTYIITEVINTPVKDIFHTSFEEGDGNSSNGDSKTGKKSRTGGYSKPVTNLTNGQYVLSYWQKSGSTWILQISTIAVSGNAYTINLTGQVDEVRFYPAAAQMTTFTYEPLIGMTSQCDVNNRITYYEYDGFGHLKLIKDQNGNIIKTMDYKYKTN